MSAAWSIEEVDVALQEWRQGDAILDLNEFLYMALREPAAGSEEQAEWGIKSTQISGCAVVTQTCDIVRGAEKRPYVEVSPLVKVTPKDLRAIQSCMRPNYAYLPGMADAGLVVDLDRTKTIEKRLLVQWSRHVGCSTDEERSTFAAALSRKRLRFAFPEEFNRGISRLRSRFIAKHEKGSEEGLALRSIREVRVLAKPDWDAGEVALDFFFVLHNPLPIERKKIVNQVKQWEKLITLPSQYTDWSFEVIALEEMTAREYVASQQLDFEHLSGVTSDK